MRGGFLAVEDRKEASHYCIRTEGGREVHLASRRAGLRVGGGKLTDPFSRRRESRCHWWL